MNEFNKGDRIIFVRDDEYAGVEMPKGTLATYDDDGLATEAPSVVLDTGERVRAWRSRIAHAEDHGTGDGSASDICAEPGCNCDLERRFPAPLDPAKVKAGDTVTLTTGKRVVTDVVQRVSRPVSGSYTEIQLEGDTAAVFVWTHPEAFNVAKPHTVLTAHTPAPEPEPEWLFEFKGEEGPEGDEHWVRRFPSRTHALRSMIESANLDELNDFEGPVSFSVYTEETGPAESRLVVIDPAALPSREALAEAITRGTRVGSDGFHSVSGPAAADRVLALLKEARP